MNTPIKLIPIHIGGPQNTHGGHAFGMDHIILASGLHSHIQDQTDAGGPCLGVVPHIGVGADMGQAIRLLTDLLRDLSKVPQPINTDTMS